MKRTKIITSGKDLKIHECEYEIYTPYDKINKVSKIGFRLFMEGDGNEDWFDFKLTPIGNDVLKVTDMFCGKASHRMKGIPEALIIESQRIFDKNIISSSEKYPILRGEWRKEPASKVWDRLVVKGIAMYDSKYDFYYLKHD